MIKIITKYLLIINFFIIFFSYNALADTFDHIFKEEMVEVSFVSSITNFDSDEKFYIGLKFNIEEDWKIYWKYPGDSGLPPELDFSKSINLNDYEIFWPFPTKEYEAADLLTNVYKRNIILPITVNVIDKNLPLNLRGIINFQVCREICIPLKANLKLDIQPGTISNTQNYFSIMKEISRVPVLYKNVGIENIKASMIKSNKLFIEVESAIDLPHGDFDIFLYTFNEYLKIQEIRFKKNSKKSIHTELLLENNIDQIKNINLIVVKGDVAFKAINNIIEYRNNSNLITILLLALVGGIILNFMPCVLPVLTLKISRLLVNHNKNIKEVRYSFISTSLGIIFSFLILALMTIFLKYLGLEVGWGMQFQQPVFIGLLILILILFSANLLNIFEFNLSSNLLSSINKFINKKKYGISFFEGAFATLLATPCSAPFLGTAVGFAFAAEPFYIILIFSFLGIGMSFPYLLVSCFPGVLKYFPKPGNWVKYLKYILALGLILTALWLLDILVTLIGIKYSSVFVFSLLISLIFFNIKVSYRKFLSIFSIIFATFLILIFIKNNNYFKVNNKLNWESFDEQKIDVLLAQNRLIFIDITADWCITCKVNKLLVLEDKNFINLVEKHNLFLMRGDLTKPNKDIMHYMQKFSRYGIPFNAIYNAANPQGILLSELLTIKELSDYLK